MHRLMSVWLVVTVLAAIVGTIYSSNTGGTWYAGVINGTLIGGAVLATSEVIRAAILSVGLEKGIRTVSGSFLLNRVYDSASTSLGIHHKRGVLHLLIDLTSDKPRVNAGDFNRRA